MENAVIRISKQSRALHLREHDVVVRATVEQWNGFLDKMWKHQGQIHDGGKRLFKEPSSSLTRHRLEEGMKTCKVPLASITWIERQDGFLQILKGASSFVQTSMSFDDVIFADSFATMRSHFRSVDREF